jgi:predicted nucleic acid-binding protein
VQLRHRGERDAILLAMEINADAILLDEEKPRTQATALGLVVIDTVGVLERAADSGLIKDLKAVHDQIRQTDFRVSDAILTNSLKRHLGN